MKRRWREIVSAWKEKCARENRNFPTIPKQAFPSLLRELMEKDYSQAVISGFEACGLYPLNVGRPLSRLPEQDKEVETQVQKELLKKLENMRYNQPASAQANRPKKKEKLPAGASYTCLPGRKPQVGVAVNVELEGEEVEGEEVEGEEVEGEEVEGEEVEVEGEEVEEVELEISSEDDFNAGDSSAVQRSAATAKKARKEFWGSESDSSEDKESSDQEKAEEDGSEESERECEREKAKDSEELLPGTYVVAVYQGAWYLGQVLDKKEERLALRQQEYTYVSFMQRVGGSGDNFKWPEKPDKLNTLREDVLFVCGAPIPAAATSSSRNISFTLSPAENKKAYMLLNKAYYHTFLILGYLIPYFQGPVVCVCVCVCLHWSF
jgi:hypothetical protein